MWLLRNDAIPESVLERWLRRDGYSPTESDGSAMTMGFCLIVAIEAVGVIVIVATAISVVLEDERNAKKQKKGQNDASTGTGTETPSASEEHERGERVSPDGDARSDDAGSIF